MSACYGQRVYATHCFPASFQFSVLGREEHFFCPETLSRYTFASFSSSNTGKRGREKKVCLISPLPPPQGGFLSAAGEKSAEECVWRKRGNRRILAKCPFWHHYIKCILIHKVQCSILARFDERYSFLEKRGAWALSSSSSFPSWQPQATTTRKLHPSLVPSPVLISYLF